MTRGELWWVDLGLPYGSEPGYRRPVLIVQNDFFNKSKINTTVIIPLTTNILYADAPGNIVVNIKESNLNKESIAVISQIKVIDKKRLKEKISKVSKEIMDQVETGMKLVLGFR